MSREPNPSNWRWMVVLNPWTTATITIIARTPMMTPSIVSRARSLLLFRAISAWPRLSRISTVRSAPASAAEAHVETLPLDIAVGRRQHAVTLLKAREDLDSGFVFGPGADGEGYLLRPA